MIVSRVQFPALAAGGPHGEHADSVWLLALRDAQSPLSRKRDYVRRNAFHGIGLSYVKTRDRDLVRRRGQHPARSNKGLESEDDRQCDAHHS